MLFNRFLPVVAVVKVVAVAYVSLVGVAFEGAIAGLCS